MKIGEFIYPWGGGHYSRMMRLDGHLARLLPDAERHYISRDHVHEKLLERFPDKADHIHEILMPMPIDGSFGPSISRSMANLLFPVAGRPPLVSQIADYLKKEGRLYDRERFDLAINDGDMGSNILADRRNVPSMFITNQFRPKLYKSRMYFYPSLQFVAKQIARAAKIVVADSPPPYTICEYNLNFTADVAEKVEYAGHFAEGPAGRPKNTDLGRLVQDCEFGYWMRTGNRSTNDATGKMYEMAFGFDQLKDKRRLVSHARADPSIDSVLGRDGNRYPIPEAADKNLDWLQIDVGFLSEDEKEAAVQCCAYAVVNGSHTVMGEILGRGKPIIGMPVYDEHTNQIRWAEEKGLGILANSPKGAAGAAAKIMDEYGKFQDAACGFAKNFVGGGGERAARIASEMLQ